jgi:hypothetical protein
MVNAPCAILTKRASWNCSRRPRDLYRRRDPVGSESYIVINSPDMKKPLEMLTASRMEELAAFLSKEVETPARAGV